MSGFTKELQIAAEFPHPESFDAFYRNIPEEWVKGSKKLSPKLVRAVCAIRLRKSLPNGQIKGFLTSLADPARYPFTDLVKVYWDRWEIEQGYGELKRWQI
ncbi:hypothetical protein [Parendozoicomonas sp. Alg238-R29]|uniref:hypothetical protein n=1 Tax=Parendozoicomonas sp. Alg238-R29 TaxID=2993446 RepID=UPI00248D5E02|nr:hypothetical protein [Parendozoicomonas sp. Alg238-R29]